MKTKFETREPEPVFEEDIHGASALDYEQSRNSEDSGVGYELEKSETFSSAGSGVSVEEEEK